MSGQEPQGGNAATEPGKGQEPKPPETPAPSQELAATPPAPGQEPKGDTSPETFSREYVEQLRSEAAANRKVAKEAAEKVQEFEDAQKSEREKAEAKAEREGKRANEAEAKLLRYDVAREKKVPTELVELLTATDREDLEKQADLILKHAKEGEKPPDFDGGAREPADTPKKPEDAHRDFLTEHIFGRPPNN